MKSWLWLALMVVAACTKPNPLNCADGNCTDPAHPFCDTDGSIAGEANTCIAVSCTPMQFQECRGDDAISCDSTGANYTVETCQLMCDANAGGCVACGSNADCSPSAPVCDLQTHDCRVCSADAECASEICESTGTCQDPSTIVYASPAGATATPCGDLGHPCAIDVAITVAESSLTKNVVKLAPGNYAPFYATVTGADNVTLYGTGATLFADSNPLLFVSEGGRLTIHGLTIQLNASVPSAIQCTTTSTTVPRASMDIDGLTISRNQATTAGVLSQGCTVSISNSQFVGIGNGALAVKSSTAVGSTMTIDKCVFDGSSVGAGPAQSDSSTLTVQNSLVLRTSVGGSTRMVFSTLVDTTVQCNMFTRPYPDVADSILYNTTATDVIPTGYMCSLSYDLLMPQSATTPAGAHLLVNMDPKFRLPATDDFHLMLGSPAIDAADPTAQDSHDLDGTARPQGAASDVGAYEYH